MPYSEILIDKSNQSPISAVHQLTVEEYYDLMHHSHESSASSDNDTEEKVTKEEFDQLKQQVTDLIAEVAAETVHQELRTSVSEIEQNVSEVTHQLDTTVTMLTSSVNEVENRVNSRMDNIIANSSSTEGNSELIDIRTGNDGTVYTTAGTAIREQLSQLKNSVRDLSDENRMNLLKSMLLHTYTDISLANHASDFRYSYDNRTNALVASNGFSNVSYIGKININIGDAQDTVKKGLIGFGTIENGILSIESSVSFHASANDTGTFEIPVNIYLNKTKTYYPCILCTGGYFMFSSSEGTHYYTFATDADHFTGTHELTAVSGNDIAFLSIETSYYFTDNEIGQYNTDTIVHVGKGDAYKYHEITEAFEHIRTKCRTEPCTIYVHAGEYQPFSIAKNRRYLNIIGDGKELVKVKSTAGIYSQPAAELAVCGLVKGITFIATHDDIESLPSGDMGSYAVHCDFWNFDPNVPMVFENCDFISFQTSGFGCGLWDNETLILRNCGFYSYYDKSFNTTQAGDYPALLIHGSVNEANALHHVIIENCHAYSKDCTKAVEIYRYRPDTIMDIEIRNSQFYSATSGINYHVSTDLLSPLSGGNNIPDLNYKYNS